MLANPKNCEMVVLAHDGMGRLRLNGRCELELGEAEAPGSGSREGGRDGGEEGDSVIADDSKANGASKDEDRAAATFTRAKTTTTVVTGYKKHSRLRTLPPEWVRPRTVRMCYTDT